MNETIIKCITGKFEYRQNNLEFFNTSFDKNDILLEKIENLKRSLSAILWFIIDMMAVKNELFYNFYPKTWVETIENEIRISKISKNDKVIHIGCGPFPITAILIEKITGAKVIAVDKNNLAVKLANEYLKKKGIKNIEIVHADGIDLSAKNYDFIIITAAVRPRKEIVDNILNTADNDCKIICREIKGTRGFVEKQLLFYITNYLVEEVKVKNSGCYYSYIFHKKYI